MNESCHICMRHVTYEWVKSRMNESCHTSDIWMSQVTHDNVDSATSHKFMSHVTHMTESHHTYECHKGRETYSSDSHRVPTPPDNSQDLPPLLLIFGHSRGKRDRSLHLGIHGFAHLIQPQPSTLTPHLTDKIDISQKWALQTFQKARRVGSELASE